MAVEQLTDLNENSSSDDVKGYVDQVIQEVEADRAGDAAEEKSDAQIVSETAGKPAPEDTPAETNSGSDADVENVEETAEAESQGEDTGDDSGQEWLTDELKAEATAYGMDESDIADFASREEMDRAFRLFDKSALEAGRKALAEAEGDSDEGQTRNEKGQFTKKDEPKADDQPAETSKPVEGRYEIKLDADVYDDEIVGELTGLRDHYESRLQEMDSRLNAYEERFAEADAIAQERHFDNLVDSLGHDDLFGKTGHETDEEKKRREDLFVDVETYLRGREVLGRPTELNDTIVQRIARSLFAEELGKKDLKKRTRKITKQSNGRQGGGATRPQDPREDPRDAADRLYRELAEA